MLSRSFAYALPLILTEAANAASLPHIPSRRDDSSSPASARFEFVNAANPYNFGLVDLEGDGAIIYVANITVDGTSYEVSLIYQLALSLGSEVCRCNLTPVAPTCG